MNWMAVSRTKSNVGLTELMRAPSICHGNTRPLASGGSFSRLMILV